MLEKAIAIGILSESIRKSILKRKGKYKDSAVGKITRKHPGKLIIGLGITGAATHQLMKRIPE